MTPNAFRAALSRLGWSQLEAARRLGVNERTARRWAEGKHRIPEAVVMVLNQKETDHG